MLPRFGGFAAAYTGFGGWSAQQPAGVADADDFTFTSEGTGKERQFRWKPCAQVSPACLFPASAADSEVVQHLRRLGKRDPTTKVKALQALRQALDARREAGQADEAAASIPAWAFYFRRTVLDNSRLVRRAASL